MTNTNERPAEEGGEWEKELDGLTGGCSCGYPGANCLHCRVEDFLSRTRKEAEEKGRSAALDEAIRVVEKWEGEIAEEISAQFDINLEDVYAFREAITHVLASLNALKGKGLNAKE